MQFLLVFAAVLRISLSFTDAQTPLNLPAPDPLTGTVASSSATGFLPDTGSNWFDRTHGAVDDSVGKPFIPGPGSPLSIYNKPEVLDPFYSKTNVFHHHHHFIIPIRRKHVKHVHHHHYHRHPHVVHHAYHHHVVHHHEDHDHDDYPENLVTVGHPINHISHHVDNHHDNNNVLDSVDVTDINKAISGVFDNHDNNNDNSNSNNKHGGHNSAIEIEFDPSGNVKTFLNRNYHKTSQNTPVSELQPKITQSSSNGNSVSAVDFNIDVPTEEKTTEPLHQTSHVVTHEKTITGIQSIMPTTERTEATHAMHMDTSPLISHADTVDPSIADAVDYGQLRMHQQQDSTSSLQTPINPVPQANSVVPGPLAGQTGYGVPLQASQEHRDAPAIAPILPTSVVNSLNAQAGTHNGPNEQLDVLNSHVITQNGYGAGFPSYPNSIYSNTIPQTGHPIATPAVAAVAPDAHETSTQTSGILNFQGGSVSGIRPGGSSEVLNQGLSRSEFQSPISVGTSPSAGPVSTVTSADHGHIDLHPPQPEIHVNAGAVSGSNTNIVHHDGNDNNNHHNTGGNHILGSAKSNMHETQIFDNYVDTNEHGSAHVQSGPSEIHVTEGGHPVDVQHSDSHDVHVAGDSHHGIEHVTEHPYAIHVSDNGHGYAVRSEDFHDSNDVTVEHHGEHGTNIGDLFHDNGANGIGDGSHDIHVQEMHGLNHGEGHNEIDVEEMHDPGLGFNIHKTESEFHDGVGHSNLDQTVVHPVPGTVATSFESSTSEVHHNGDSLGHDISVQDFESDLGQRGDLHASYDHTREGAHLETFHEEPHVEVEHVHHHEPHVEHHTEETHENVDHFHEGPHVVEEHINDGSHMGHIPDEGHLILENSNGGAHLSEGPFHEGLHGNLDQGPNVIEEQIHEEPHVNVEHVHEPHVNVEPVQESHVNVDHVNMDSLHNEPHLILEHGHDEAHVVDQHLQDEPHVNVEHVHEEAHPDVVHTQEEHVVDHFHHEEPHFEHEPIDTVVNHVEHTMQDEPHMHLKHVNHEQAHVEVEHHEVEPMHHEETFHEIEHFHEPHGHDIPLPLHSNIAPELHHSNVWSNDMFHETHDHDMPLQMHSNVAPELHHSNVLSNDVPEFPGEFHDHAVTEGIAPELRESNAHSNVVPELHPDHSVSFAPEDHTESAAMHGYDEHGHEYFLPGGAAHTEDVGTSTTSTEVATKTELAPHPGDHDDANNVHIDEKDEEMIKKARENEIVDPPFLRHNDMHGDGFGEGVVPGPDINIGGTSASPADGHGLPSPVSVNHAEIIPNGPPFVGNNLATQHFETGAPGLKRQTSSAPQKTAFAGKVSIGTPKQPITAKKRSNSDKEVIKGLAKIIGKKPGRNLIKKPNSTVVINSPVTKLNQFLIKKPNQQVKKQYPAQNKKPNHAKNKKPNRALGKKPGQGVKQKSIRPDSMKPKVAKSTLGSRREGLSGLFHAKKSTEFQNEADQKPMNSVLFQTVPNEAKVLAKTVPNEVRHREDKSSKIMSLGTKNKQEKNSKNSVSSNVAEKSTSKDKGGSKESSKVKETKFKGEETKDNDKEFGNKEKAIEVKGDSKESSKAKETKLEDKKDNDDKDKSVNNKDKSSETKKINSDDKEKDTKAKAMKMGKAEVSSALQKEKSSDSKHFSSESKEKETKTKEEKAKMEKAEVSSALSKEKSESKGPESKTGKEKESKNSVKNENKFGKATSPESLDNADSEFITPFSKDEDKNGKSKDKKTQGDKDEKTKSSNAADKTKLNSSDEKKDDSKNVESKKENANSFKDDQDEFETKEETDKRKKNGNGQQERKEKQGDKEESKKKVDGKEDEKKKADEALKVSDKDNKKDEKELRKNKAEELEKVTDQELKKIKDKAAEVLKATEKDNKKDEEEFTNGKAGALEKYTDQELRKIKEKAEEHKLNEEFESEKNKKAEKEEEEKLRKTAKEESDKKGEEEKKMKDEEKKLKIKKEEQEEQNKKEEVELKKKKDEATKKAEEEMRQVAKLKADKKANEEEKKKIAKMEFEKKKEEQEEQNKKEELEFKKKVEEEAKFKAEEEMRKVAKMKADKKKEEEERKKITEEEFEKKKEEQEEQNKKEELEFKKRVEEEARFKAEEEMRRVAKAKADKKLEEEERKKNVENFLKMKKEEQEEQNKKEEVEMKKKKAEEESRKQKEKVEMDSKKKEKENAEKQKEREMEESKKKEEEKNKLEKQNDFRGKDKKEEESLSGGNLGSDQSTGGDAEKSPGSFASKADKSSSKEDRFTSEEDQRKAAKGHSSDKEKKPNTESGEDKSSEGSSVQGYASVGGGLGMADESESKTPAPLQGQTKQAEKEKANENGFEQVGPQEDAAGDAVSALSEGDNKAAEESMHKALGKVTGKIFDGPESVNQNAEGDKSNYAVDTEEWQPSMKLQGGNSTLDNEDSQSTLSKSEESQSMLSQPEESQSQLSKSEESQSVLSKPEESQSMLSKSEEGQSLLSKPEESQSMMSKPEESQSHAENSYSQSLLGTVDSLLTKSEDSLSQLGNSEDTKSHASDAETAQSQSSFAEDSQSQASLPEDSQSQASLAEGSQSQLSTSDDSQLHAGKSETSEEETNDKTVAPLDSPLVTSMAEPTMTPTQMFLGINDKTGAPTKPTQGSSMLDTDPVTPDRESSEIDGVAKSVNSNDYAYSPEKAVLAVAHALNEEKDGQMANQRPPNELEETEKALQRAKGPKLGLTEREENELLGSINPEIETNQIPTATVSYYEKKTDVEEPRSHEDDVLLKRDRPFRYGGSGRRKQHKQERKPKKGKRKNSRKRFSKRSSLSAYNTDIFQTKRRVSLRDLLKR